MSKKENILVTGGMGCIGSALCNRLVKQGHWVTALDNNSRDPDFDLLHNDVEIAILDIRNKNHLFDGGEKFDTIYHLAAINGTSNFYNNPFLVLDVGIKGTLNIINYARKFAKKLIVFSSSEVYNIPTQIPTTEEERLIIPDPHNPRFSYAGSKIAAELLTIHSGLNSAIIRPHNVIIPGEKDGHLIPDIINKIMTATSSSYEVPISIQGDGTETRSFVFIDDFIDGLLIAAENTNVKCPIFNIGTENEIKISDLVHMIADILEVKIKIVPGKLTEGSTLRRCPSIEKIRKLGYEPKVGLREGLEKTIKWYKENYEKNK